MMDDVQGMLKMGEGHCFASFLPILFLSRPVNAAMKIMHFAGDFKILSAPPEGPQFQSPASIEMFVDRFSRGQPARKTRPSAAVSKKLGAERPERVG